MWWWVTMALAVSPQEVPNPRQLDVWVTDLAKVIDAEDEATINALLDALEAETTVEVAVVAVPSVSSPTPKQFTTELFNHWGVGKAGADNGLLVVLSIEDRRVEMEPGYGLAPILTDGWLGTMQSELMVPEFRAGDYGEGLLVGLRATDAKLREQALEARMGAKARELLVQTPWPERPTSRPASAGWRWHSDEVWMVSGGLSGVLLLFGGWLFWRRRQRTCVACRVYMPMLEESEEDVHLDSGQLTEEAIGSVDWHVHACVLCDEIRVFRRAHWFSGYSNCPECKNRTRSSSRTTLSPATYTSSGSAQVSERCAHCSYSNTYTVAIPRKQRAKSSSSSSSFGSSSGSSFGSSSGSSFGGGSSGGGGAGSSW